MPKPSKRHPKPSSSSSTTPTLPSTPHTPSPFTPAPPALTPFLTTLSPTHIYITSIDTHPPALKRRIYLVPLLLNILLSLGLLYRAYIALPTYFSIFVATLGYDNPEKVHVAETDWGELGRTMVARSGLFVLDFVLFRGVGGWPWGFFVGVGEDEGSSALWRWRVGVREREVVVRRSRRWDRVLLAGEKAEEGGGMKEWASNGDKVERDEDGVMRERIMPAVAPGWVRGKTGYLMMDKSWDLDFGGMIAAHDLVDASSSDISSSSAAASQQPEFSLESFKTQVLIHEHGKGWLVWPVWKLEEQQGGKQDSQRQKIVKMKDRLTALGKENLFFRWVEMVQFESNEEGGFTLERQQRAVAKAKEMFEAQGVDFEKFWSSIDGGVEGMMGMEVVK